MTDGSKIEGTNCFNCKYIDDEREESVSAQELNTEGGLDPKNDEEMRKAKEADLITLPGGTKRDATTKKYCDHEKIETYVTARMCCAYWDNERVKRPWKE